MCERQLQPDEIFRLSLEIRGPKSEEDMKRFRDALKALLTTYQVRSVELNYKVQ